MADFNDVIFDAQPAIAIATWEVTEGKTWKRAFSLEADLTGVTGECKALTDIGGSVVVEITVTVDATDPDLGIVTLSADPSVTAGVGGTSGRKRICPWYLTLTKGTDKAAMWGLQESRLIINQGE